jgi:hypothetical protein
MKTKKLTKKTPKKALKTRGPYTLHSVSPAIVRGLTSLKAAQAEARAKSIASFVVLDSRITNVALCIEITERDNQNVAK